MPLQKQAAIRVKNFGHLTRAIGNAAKTSGGKLADTPENIARNIMYGKHGTASLTTDAGKWFANKLSGKHKLGDKFGRKFSDMQRSITDFDIRAGNKIYERLDKSNKRLAKSLKGTFINKQQVPMTGDLPGQARRVAEIDVPGFSNPLMKAKDAAVPIAGSMYLTSKIYGDDSAKEGDSHMKESEYRSRLIEKVAAALQGQSDQKTPDKKVPEVNCELALMKKASTALKVSAGKQRQLEEDNQKLAEENKRLKYENECEKKRQEAEKVAFMMSAKGVLRKQDIPIKTAELVNLDNEAFGLFKEAVENLMHEEKSAETIDSLTFVSGQSNLNKRKTLADSLQDN